jgi:hypothetical protein
MSNFRLYEISEMLEQALSNVRKIAEENEGVIPDDWDKFLDEIQMERDKKVLDCARYIKSLRAEAEAIKNEKQNLGHRQSSLENEADRIEVYIAKNINIGEKVSDENTKLSWRKSTSVDIFDELKIPDSFCQIIRNPKKADIKISIQTGKIVEGARLIEKQDLQIK